MPQLTNTIIELQGLLYDSELHDLSVTQFMAIENALVVLERVAD